MSPTDALAIVAAGFAAGTVNVIVGSGSLITFPTLLALGYPPVLANVSNTVGLVPGSVSGVVAYRGELVGQRNRVLQLGSASLLGGLVGAVLLLSLPHSVFKAAVPVLIALAVLLMAVQPRMSARLEAGGGRRTHGGPVLLVGVFLTGIYGGYFGAAQGVILIALLAIFIDDDLHAAQRCEERAGPGGQRCRPASSSSFATHVSWSVVGLIAVGSIVGGSGRRALRAAPPRRHPPLGDRGGRGWAWPSAWPSSGTEPPGGADRVDG